jgi:hypothetical protein
MTNAWRLSAQGDANGRVLLGSAKGVTLFGGHLDELRELLRR